MISASRYRRCPPSVLIAESFPALAQRVTVFGSTRNNAATSAGVNNRSASFLVANAPPSLAPPTDAGG